MLYSKRSKVYLTNHENSITCEQNRWLSCQFISNKTSRFFNPLYDYFAECEIGVQWGSANSLAWSFAQSVNPSLGRKLLFVFPLTNAQHDLTKRKVSSNGSASSREWGVWAFFVFEFSKITWKAFVFVVMKWTHEKCGFSHDDNWGINIEKMINGKHL